MRAVFIIYAIFLFLLSGCSENKKVKPEEYFQEKYQKIKSHNYDSLKGWIFLSGYPHNPNPDFWFSLINDSIMDSRGGLHIYLKENKIGVRIIDKSDKELLGKYYNIDTGEVENYLCKKLGFIFDLDVKDLIIGDDIIRIKLDPYGNYIYYCENDSVYNFVVNTYGKLNLIEDKWYYLINKNSPIFIQPKENLRKSENE